ncbi:MAG: hypothetical protein K8S25_12455, partial [Alphaproteobacteria bacterium]|nr:hypothetical protein [Alphaproteobacteria bacterium]
MSKFASLTAGLLARKGEAEPIATPFADQLLTRVGMPDEAADVRALTPMPRPHVHTHVEPGIVKKPPPAKPLNDSVTSIFGTFGKRSAQEIARARQDSPLDILRAPLPAPVLAHDEEEHTDSHCGTCPGPSAEDGAKTFHVNLRMKRRRFVKLKLSAA